MLCQQWLVYFAHRYFLIKIQFTKKKCVINLNKWVKNISNLNLWEKEQILKNCFWGYKW